jgi:hypothetical protein
MRLNLFRVALVLFILFTASGVWAESSVWVVRSSKANVYLAGSFHMLRASDYPLPAEFLQLIRIPVKSYLKFRPVKRKVRNIWVKFLKLRQFTMTAQLLKSIFQPRLTPKRKASVKNGIIRWSNTNF